MGRSSELEALGACLRACRHVLLEGPPGVGKTALARGVAAWLGRGIERVDGDGRATEASLVGRFDPPLVLEVGYSPAAWRDGPLLRALRGGGLLLLNELNRMPEGVQNVLLPALDEGVVQVPGLGPVPASPGFGVIATQNPVDHVGTGPLSEALLDRFELIRLRWQGEDEERRIVTAQARCGPSPELVAQAVALVRATREDPAVRRGASVRAAVAVADLAVCLDGDLERAALLALPTRLELADVGGPSLEELLARWTGKKKPGT